LLTAAPPPIYPLSKDAEAVMVKPQTETEATKALRTNEKKWTKPLMAAGWICFPSTIIERQRALGLDALDINIVLHLAMYWWHEGSKPHPSKRTIAQALNVEERTVQRRIARMEAIGFIRREERRVPGQGSRTNLYHLDGLIKAAEPYAEEKIQEIAAKEAERTKRAARKGKPKLHVVASTP
jgi:predicted transcriptional regulator